MIKAVIFDCFGVLTTEGFDRFRDKYLGDDEPKRQQANKAMDEVNMALIGYRTFLEILAQLAGLKPAEVEAVLEANQPNEPLLEYIRVKLKPKYKIGMLSNAGDDWISEIFSPNDIKLFDSIILSFRVGLIKPQPEIYKLTAGELGVETAECVFIDDREKYCAGAHDVGMKAILYDDFKQMKSKLEKLLNMAEKKSNLL
ncbi:HAD family phosphatase [Candidatus Saccharibacteria bacterium]|nr:HAD family phosphatase [Candidatus Saccharibacteria bacterium]